MKRLLADESGASSVLIVFMMLVLVILGAYSISSSRVNYTFSVRALEWKQTYYEREKEAEQFLVDTDIALAEAERKTAEAVLTGEALNIIEGNAEQSINKLYKQHVVNELSTLSERYPDIEVNEGGSVITRILPSNEKFQIKVKLAVLPFRYSIDSGNGQVKGVLNEAGKRYAILEWKQLQKISEEAATQEPLWDGIVR